MELKKRHLETRLPINKKRTLVLLTGARQTGKTTLAKKIYPDLRYINFDSIEDREKISAIRTADWGKTIGNVVIDEVQKEPAVFDKIKCAFDEENISFSVLLGSSQILLLNKIRESLAGRVSIYEIFPLMISELCSEEGEIPPTPFLDLLVSSPNMDKILQASPSVLFGKEESTRMDAQSFVLEWGGMPTLLHLEESERRKWIKDYEYTYLERDLADLARLKDLQLFRTFQKISSLRSGNLLNYSELARDTGLSVDTSRRYIEYLKLSYQVAFLRPYYKNITSTLVKTPKIYWLDIGILRQLSGYFGPTNGQIFETMVVSEIYKWIKTKERQVEMYFYRTQAGLEVDLLLETAHGVIGIEIKSRKKLASKDTRSLKEIGTKLNQEWLGGLVVYDGNALEKIGEPNIWAIPAWRLLS